MFDENHTRRRRRGRTPVRLVTAKGDPAEDTAQEKQQVEESLNGSAKLLLQLQLHHRHGYGEYSIKNEGE
jgi:hypothetical protein